MIPGRARFSIDIRHAHDQIRVQAVNEMLARARSLAGKRGVELIVSAEEHHAAVAADRLMSDQLAEALAATGHHAHHLVSGAGHDAGIMSAIAPMAMLFLRSPGGVSHHPDERVLLEDVAVGLDVLIHYLDLLAGRPRAPGERPRMSAPRESPEWSLGRPEPEPTVARPDCTG